MLFSSCTHLKIFFIKNPYFPLAVSSQIKKLIYLFCWYHFVLFVRNDESILQNVSGCQWNGWRYFATLLLIPIPPLSTSIFFNRFPFKSIPASGFVAPIVNVLWMKYSTRFSSPKYFHGCVLFPLSVVNFRMLSQNPNTHQNRHKIEEAKETIEKYACTIKRPIPRCWHFNVSLLVILYIYIFCLAPNFFSVWISSNNLLLGAREYVLLFIIYIMRADRHFTMIYTRHSCAHTHDDDQMQCRESPNKWLAIEASEKRRKTKSSEKTDEHDIETRNHKDSRW